MQVIQDGTDRVRIHDVTGEPPPPTLKVCLNHVGGFRNDVSFVLVGLDIEAKAKLVRQQMEAALPKLPAEMVWNLLRTDREDADEEARASALLRVVAKDRDPSAVGRAFSGVAVELALSSYPGFTLTAPPGEGSPYGVYSAAFVQAGAVPHVAVLGDGTRIAIPPSEQTLPLAPVPAPALPPSPRAPGEVVRGPLGRIMGARSGDKGGTANIGVWARSEEGFRWLVHTLDVAKLQALLPETAAFPVERHLLPKLWAMNFVVDGLLGEGVSSSPRFDPQGKALGEWLRARHVDIPRALMP